MFASSGICVQQCPSNASVYQNSTGSFCFYCDPSCVTCTDSNSSTACATCPSNNPVLQLAFANSPSGMCASDCFSNYASQGVPNVCIALPALTDFQQQQVNMGTKISYAVEAIK